MINVLIIPDSYKGCMTAKEVTLIMKKVVKKVFSESYCTLMPFSDGGEGALEVLKNNADGYSVKCWTTDALLRPIEGNYFRFKKHKSAWIELSQTAGIDQLYRDEYNPLVTSTLGTGKMILHALDHGCNEIYLGIGGSATHDFGTGIITALNGRFLDQKNKRLPNGGGNLTQLNRIDLSMINHRVKKVKWTIACDVKNPLLGNQGAANTYAHQKGATPDMIDQLEFAGKQFANVVLSQFGVDIRSVKGGGAAGGVGAGLYGLLNAELKNGFDLLADLTGVQKKISKMDLVITGEGTFDRQSLFGKLPIKVAQMTQSKKIPTLIIAGHSTINHIPNMPHVKIYNTKPEKISIEQALEYAPLNLEVKLLKVLEQFKSINKLR
jgi:glycerate kinase